MNLICRGVFVTPRTEFCRHKCSAPLEDALLQSPTSGVARRSVPMDVELVAWRAGVGESSRFQDETRGRSSGSRKRGVGKWLTSLGVQ